MQHVHLDDQPEQHVGATLYDTRIGPDREKRNHIRQLDALGFKATLEPAA